VYLLKKKNYFQAITYQFVWCEEWKEKLHQKLFYLFINEARQGYHFATSFCCGNGDLCVCFSLSKDTQIVVGKLENEKK
jgi:hypothetical protein